MQNTFSIISYINIQKEIVWCYWVFAIEFIHNLEEKKVEIFLLFVYFSFTLLKSCNIISFHRSLDSKIMKLYFWKNGMKEWMRERRKTETKIVIKEKRKGKNSWNRTKLFSFFPFFSSSIAQQMFCCFLFRSFLFVWFSIALFKISNIFLSSYIIASNINSKWYEKRKHEEEKMAQHFYSRNLLHSLLKQLTN